MLRFIFLLLLAAPLQGAWLTDLTAAKDQAAKEGKGIYLVFTSLKFSGACVQLEKRVLSQESFQKAVEDRFVLVQLDVPLQQTPGMVSPLAANLVVAQKFGVQSYPTGFLLDEKGRSYASQSGALINDPEKYAAGLREIADAQKNRVAKLKSASEKEGLEKASAIIEVLREVPSTANPEIYQEYMEALAKADPDDSLGFQKKRLAEQGFHDLDRALREVFGKDSHDQVEKLVDDYVARFDPEGELLQKALFPKLAALNQSGEKERAMKAAEEVIAVDENSAHGKFAAQIFAKLKSGK